MEELTIGSIPETGREADGEDRISCLPDEIIHNILHRLPSPKKVAKLSILSKRWNHLWLSYPILRLNENEFRSRSELRPRYLFDKTPVYAPRGPLQGFMDALLRKLSHPAATISVVRITVAEDRWGAEFCSDFLDGVMGRLVPSSTKEIDFRFGHDITFGEELIPSDYNAYNVPQRLLQFHKLKVLKLAFCSFRLYDEYENNPFAGLGSCLELLSLHHVSFPNDRSLNDMIASSPRLKSLQLFSVFGVTRFQIRNHPNLESLEANRLIGDIVEITDCHSLHILKFTEWEKGELQVSSTPNLKVLHIGNEYSRGVITDSQIHKFIRELPASMESIRLRQLSLVHELELVNSEKLQKVRLFFYEVNDARRLINFVYNVIDRQFPGVASTEATNRSSLQAPIHCNFDDEINFQELKQFLRKLCRFRVTLELCTDELCGEPVKDDLPIPIVESVRLTSFAIFPRRSESIPDKLLDTCHPKVLFMEHTSFQHFQLLDLSSERKAEEINIYAWALSFPFRLLSNSATKILRLTGVQFYYNKHCDGFPLSLNSLRVLQLTNVFFDEDQLFQNLIASSPLLETLEIETLYRRMRKLKVSTHHTNLKSLRIARCFPREIEITAPGLQTLRLEDLQLLSKFELTAPQLNLLEITHYSPRLKHRCFDLVLPNLRSLKSLTLNDPELQKKLKLSNPN
ncbi:hypothetical protein LINGRAHAP2_LOCUS28483 [Linum grandiflorum]